MNASIRGWNLANFPAGPDDSVVATTWRASVKPRLLVALLSLTALAVVGAAAARAGSCRVLVALGSVEIEPSPAGMSLRISGNWEFDNLMQVVSGLSYNVLLVRGDRFVRFHFPDQVFSGLLTGLGNQVDAGVNGATLMALEAAGVPQSGARFVSLEAQRMKLSSPVPLGTGPITVLAYLVLDGDYVSPILSNSITRPLELVDPTVKSEDSETGGTEPTGTEPTGSESSEATAP